MGRKRWCYCFDGEWECHGKLQSFIDLRMGDGDDLSSVRSDRGSKKIKSESPEQETRIDQFKRYLKNDKICR